MSFFTDDLIADLDDGKESLRKLLKCKIWQSFQKQNQYGKMNCVSLNQQQTENKLKKTDNFQEYKNMKNPSQNYISCKSINSVVF